MAQFGQILIAQLLLADQRLHEFQRRALKYAVGQATQQRCPYLLGLLSCFIDVGRTLFFVGEIAFFDQIAHNGHDRGIGHRTGFADTFVDLSHTSFSQVPNVLENLHFGFAERGECALSHDDSTMLIVEYYEEDSSRVKAWLKSFHPSSLYLHPFTWEPPALSLVPLAIFRAAPMIRLVLLVLLVSTPFAVAQVTEPAPLVVLNLAAHPDDEDALTMTHYRHAHNAVVHSIIFTRGEGGQNEIGPELYAELGAIRTVETEAAARHYGTQVHYLNFNDFGYSRYAWETFNHWGGEDVVTERLVFFIRKLKPDVIFTNHDTVTVAPNRQHGHHQVVGISAYRAMTLAADSTFAPHQLLHDGIDLWQPQRLFIRARGGAASRADVRVPVGDIIPHLGRSAADIAVEGVAEHRSQGFDLFAPRFRQDTTYFSLLTQALDAPALSPGATDLAENLPENPFAAQQDLVHWIDSGRIPLLPWDIVLSDSVVVPSQKVYLDWTPILSRDYSVRVVTPSGRFVRQTPEGFEIPNVELTFPKAQMQYRRFVSHPPFQMVMEVDGQPIAASHVPLEVAHDLTLELPDAVALPGADMRRILLRPGPDEIRMAGTVYARGQDSVHVHIGDKFGTAGEAMLAVVDGRYEGTIPIMVNEAVLSSHEHLVVSDRYLLYITVRQKERTLAAVETGLQYAVIEGRALPEVNLPENLRVGIVVSYDGTTATALRGMGATVVELDSLALAEGSFEDLHTIVVDIRAYLVREDLKLHNDRLLEWVENGGHLVVNYHKTMEWNDQPEPWAPIPLVLGRDRVTFEDAPVTHLLTDHPLFHFPNQITESDWDGWIQERGLYFPASYDPAFVELLSMHDPDDQPRTSSTLIAQVGNGTYLYTALGWYRQLGAYVPGAYRIFANMVSLPLMDK